MIWKIVAFLFVSLQSKTIIMRHTQRYHLVLLFAMVLLLAGCATSRSVKQISRVEIGMSQKKVKRLLGAPEYRSATTENQQWGFKREQSDEVIGIDEVVFLVTFDNNGKVVAFRTMSDADHHSHFGLPGEALPILPAR